MSNFLASIDGPQDLKQLEPEQLPKLAQELRDRIIEVVSDVGGHLAPSLGAVEMCIALHYILDTPHDQVVWDMGYQGYAHKLLTGRRETFHTLRRQGGLMGFSNQFESHFDPFTAGHAGTAISTSFGLASARDLSGGTQQIAAIIGDAALGSGLAFEGLNQVGHSGTDLVVILNDNKHSIARSVGALSTYLNRVITDPLYNRMREEVRAFVERIPKVGTRFADAATRIEEGLKNLLVPGILFEELGFRYFGPIDGNDLDVLIPTLQDVFRLKGPRLIHLVTTKGQGYAPAEQAPEAFHRTPPFDIPSGRPRVSTGSMPTYTESFTRVLLRQAERDERVVAITAAMRQGTGLKEFGERFPERYFDVGIAEQHGVAFAAGLAKGGLRPVVAIYSTFLQRAFDQIVHDLSLQKLPVILAVDRAGFVGTDGPTHQGAYDLAYLRTIPDIVVMAPKDTQELEHMFEFAFDYTDGPVAIRYARDRGPVPRAETGRSVPVELGRGEMLREGEDLAIIAVGVMVYPALEAADLLAAEGIDVSVINARFVKPLDDELIERAARQCGSLLVVEEATTHGGFGSAVMESLSKHGVDDVQVRCHGMPDAFVDHAERPEQLAMTGLTAEGIARIARTCIRREVTVTSTSPQELTVD